MTTTAGLEMRAVTYRHRGSERPILTDLSMRFDPGTTTLITGPVGAGKSTLIHLLASLIRPTSGEILAGGLPVSRFTGHHRDRWRQSVGLVFQHSLLFDEQSVLENITLPLYPLKLSRDEMRERTESVIAALGLGPLRSTAVATLSGGERQRTALARALVTVPTYLFVDEPTAHLDDAGAETLLTLLAAARRRGAVVIAVSHDPRLCTGPCFDGAYGLSHGRLTPLDQS